MPAICRARAAAFSASATPERRNAISARIASCICGTASCSSGDPLAHGALLISGTIRCAVGCVLPPCLACKASNMARSWGESPVPPPPPGGTAPGGRAAGAPAAGSEERTITSPVLLPFAIEVISASRALAAAIIAASSAPVASRKNCMNRSCWSDLFLAVPMI